MGILSENDMYLKAAERAFYRNPFSDLLIISFSALNSEDDRWKGLQLPVLLVPDSGAVPRATQREIARRKRANLYVWGDLGAIADEMLDELSTITRGKVYRILAHREKEKDSPAEEVLNPPGASENDSAPDIKKAKKGDSAVESLKPEAGGADYSPGENHDTKNYIKTEGEIQAENDHMAEKPALTEDASQTEKLPDDVLVIAEGNLEQENQEVQAEQEHSPEQKHALEQETCQAPPAAAAKEIPPSGCFPEESPEISGPGNIQAAPGEETTFAENNIFTDTRQVLPEAEELIGTLMATLTQKEIPQEESAQEEMTQIQSEQNEDSPAEATSEIILGEKEYSVINEEAEKDASWGEIQLADEDDKKAEEDESDEEAIKETDKIGYTARKNIIVWRFPK